MTRDQAGELAHLSFQIGRQIGLLIDRAGRPYMVIIGEPGGIFIPDLSRARRFKGRLRGLRLVHTHLREEPLSREDLMDMLFLRLDSVAALTMDNAGRAKNFYLAHLLPPNPEKKPYAVFGPIPAGEVDVDFAAQTQALEAELGRIGQTLDTAESPGGERDRALLVSVGTESRSFQERSLEELADLSRTAGLDVVGNMVQRVPKVNPKFILGKGKLADLETMALQGNAGVILFDQVLGPAQMRNLALITERKILDRTQLILDIFAQHAVTKAGKLQVELAQLQYTLPRLVGRNRALSRLAGGIGGRGPGETKLELDRRKIRDRITRIRRELKKLRNRRKATRLRRAGAGVPVAALVGYTNAGKSTLLNTLTRSRVTAEDKLFATLDPTTRRLRFPRERELILTDTVGFIRNLPEELKEAFRATFEELEAADLLIHVADVGHQELEAQVDAVQEVLLEMGFHEIPRILALNKWDTLDDEERILVKNIYPDAVPVCALSRETLRPLVEELVRRVF
ncbi:MAG: GTPase HflX [Thermodesulfobacteriota bacterium]|nr:GTPase HflX [Thermodesulfobacteriota bacterium]